MIRVTNKKMILAPKGTEITEDVVKDAINAHRTLVDGYLENERMYMSDHDILHKQAKEPYKPDNRLVVNYAKYIVDTFSGYHLGVPLKVSHDDEQVDQFVSDFRNLNNMLDSEFELAKRVDIFGHAFIYLYQDEDSKTRMTYESPVNMLIVHDDSVRHEPIFAIRYIYPEGMSEGHGEVITDQERIYFDISAGSTARIIDREPHVYGKLPVIEMIANDERQGIFESVKTLIKALNKAVSEKANDVDYFADAYLKVIGLELDESESDNIRDSRIFNLWGDNPNLDVSFLEKPNADETQENLIDFLKESIFSISMVSNLSDENFGNSSGTALAYKLQAMSNLAKVKDRKMRSAMNRMYQAIMSVPLSHVPPDAWQDLKYKFTRNVPRNVLEEAQIVRQLDGQVSDATKLSVLSIVDDVKAEIEEQQREAESNLLRNQNLIFGDRQTDDQANQEEDNQDERG